MLSLKNFTYGFSQGPVLPLINLEAHKGELVSLVGKSGSGKSTILKCIAGILSGYSGVATIAGTPANLYQKPIAYMEQNAALLPWKKVLCNLTLPLRLRGINRTEAAQQVQELAPEFGLEGLLNRYPTELSGGQAQRACLLRCLLTHAELVLLDEPFSKLDAITKLALEKFLYNIQQRYRFTALLVTHDIEEALLLASRVYVLTQKEPLSEAIKLPHDQASFEDRARLMPINTLKTQILHML